MSVIKRGKVWYLKFRPFGKQLQIALKSCETKRQALSVETELSYALKSKDFSTLSKTARVACVNIHNCQNWELPPELKPEPVRLSEQIITLGDGFGLFARSETYTTAKYPYRYRVCIEHLERHFKEGTPIKDIWTPQIRTYRTKRQDEGVKAATINREVGTLSRIFQVLIDHRLVEVNPCRLISRLSEKDGQRAACIGYDDIRRIMDCCPSWYADIVWVGYLTGMRRSEIINLKWRGVNLNKRIISLHTSETKERHFKKIPIHKYLIPVFERLGKIRDLTDDHVFRVNNHPIPPDTCKRPWDRALDKLKWAKPRPRFHDLRHSWLTNARRSKIDHEMRQAILGHSDRTLPVTERYGWINDKEFVEAIDKLVTFESETIILTAANG